MVTSSILREKSGLLSGTALTKETRLHYGGPHVHAGGINAISSEQRGQAYDVGHGNIFWIILYIFYTCVLSTHSSFYLVLFYYYKYYK